MISHLGPQKVSAVDVGALSFPVCLQMRKRWVCESVETAQLFCDDVNEKVPDRLGVSENKASQEPP